MSQASIKRALREGEKISQLTALRDHSCMRLAAVIHRLRKQGMRIRTDERHQNGKTFAVYRYEPCTEDAPHVFDLVENGGEMFRVCCNCGHTERGQKGEAA